jgi:hypothetical protein
MCFKNAAAPADRHPLRSAWHGKNPSRFRAATKLLDAVWQCEADVPHIRRIHYHRVRELAHAPGLLGAKQVTLAGMPAHDFAGGSYLEALGRAAMGLQLLFLVLLHNFLSNLICPGVVQKKN